MMICVVSWWRKMSSWRHLPVSGVGLVDGIGEGGFFGGEVRSSVEISCSVSIVAFPGNRIVSSPVKLGCVPGEGASGEDPLSEASCISERNLLFWSANDWNCSKRLGFCASLAGLSTGLESGLDEVSTWLFLWCVWVFVLSSSSILPRSNTLPESLKLRKLNL